MNRQTLAVALGTLAVVVIGGFLLYATPGPESTRARPDPAGRAERVGEKAKRVGDSPRKLSDEKLVHASEIPADRPAAPAGAPNVVVLVASTQRRDQWAAYGGMPSAMPFLAEKAKEGVRMMDALSVAVDPRPADGAIVTGSYPHHIGLVEATDKKNLNPIADEATTLAERLQTAGWFTVGLTANHNLNARAGGAQGFDWYRDSQPFSLMVEQRIDAGVLVDKTLERVAARTEAEKARPMYLQLAFVDSHKPFKVPPDESKAFEREGDETAPYRATLHRLDEAVKKLVEGLAAQGLTPENTIFTIIADHGEGLDLPPAHRKQHGFVLYRSTVQIPWLVWGKGIPAGRDVNGLVSQIDFAPSIASLAGLKELGPTDGVDVSGAILGTTETTRAQAYADTYYEGANRASVWTGTHQCQRDYGSALVEEDQFETGCHDRVADPDFTKTIEQPELMAALEKQRAELMQAVPAPVAEEGKAEKAEKAGKAGKASKAGKAKAD